MVTDFHASESVSIPVPLQPIATVRIPQGIAHYLRQPQRLINAVTDQSQVEILKDTDLLGLGHRTFRLKMQPLHFLQIAIQPTVDLDVWAEADGKVHLRSVGTEIRGTKWINQRFSLKLVGQIAPHTDAQGQTRLVGKADLKVSVDIPPIFLLTPPLVIEIAGNSLLRSVLLTIKQRLMHQLVADYVIWAKSSPTPAIAPANAIITPF